MVVAGKTPMFKVPGRTRWTSVQVTDEALTLLPSPLAMQLAGGQVEGSVTQVRHRELEGLGLTLHVDVRRDPDLREATSALAGFQLEGPTEGAHRGRKAGHGLLVALVILEFLDGHAVGRQSLATLGGGVPLVAGLCGHQGSHGHDVAGGQLDIDGVAHDVLLVERESWSPYRLLSVGFLV